jgi:integrase
VATVARQAGIGHVHPHQLRHTLATQAINRGMRLEAIAALLGHRSMEMMAAARAHRLPRYRIVVEILARTGLRASELCNLAADAVTQIGDGHWLRVPVGKLRNDRIIPLHPELVELLAEWTATNIDHIRQRRLLADEHAPLDRRTVHRMSLARAMPASLSRVRQVWRSWWQVPCSSPARRRAREPKPVSQREWAALARGDGERCARVHRCPASPPRRRQGGPAGGR